MAEIALFNGRVAMVDDNDLPLISKYKWSSWKAPNSSTYYAVTRFVPEPPQAGRRQRVVRYYMHRLIMGLDGPRVDHRNGNGLDNQRSNLRHCNASQNGGNSAKHRAKSSQFKGVHFDKKTKRWVAMIKKDRRSMFIAQFKDEESAARAYDDKARELFGSFARTNF